MKMNWANAVTGTAAIAIVGGQTALFVTAGIWAAGGILHLPVLIVDALYLVGIAGAMTVVVLFARSVHAVEPLWTNDDDPHPVGIDGTAHGA